MNICVITARLTCEPARFLSFGQYFTEVQVNFLHSKSYFARAIVLADNKTGENISKFYCQGDYVLVEGECVVAEDSYQNNWLAVYATDVQPAHLIIEE